MLVAPMENGCMIAYENPHVTRPGDFDLAECGCDGCGVERAIMLKNGQFPRQAIRIRWVCTNVGRVGVAEIVDPHT